MPPLRKQIKDFTESTTLNDESLYLTQFWDSINSLYITKHVKQTTLNKYVVKPIDILYADFYTLIINNELIPEMVYRITDYQSSNFLNGRDAYINNTTPFANFDPTEIYTSPIEVILVKAKSTNSIYPMGTSETFTNDIIYYDPIQNMISERLEYYTGSPIIPSFELEYNPTDGVYLSVPNELLLGKYLYIYAEFDGGSVYLDIEIDTIDSLTPTITSDLSTIGLPNSIEITDSNFKIKLTSLVEGDYLLYDLGTLYVYTDVRIHNITGKIYRRIDTKYNIDVCIDWRNVKYRRFEVTATTSGISTNYYGIGNNFIGMTNTGLFDDFYIFNNQTPHTSNTYNVKIITTDFNANHLFDNVVFLQYCKNTTIYAKNFKQNTFIEMSNSTIYEEFTNNVIGIVYGSKFIGDIANNECYVMEGVEINRIFSGNVIGSVFKNNKINDLFSNNVIGVQFQNNIIGDTFTNNTIGTLCNSNNFGIYFSGNTIGNGFIYNNFVYGTLNNIFSNNFQYNNIKTELTSTNFTTATHVKQNYNCDIIKGSDLTLYLTYFNGAAIQYVSPTA